jgi:hypothetical protein
VLFGTTYLPAMDFGWKTRTVHSRERTASILLMEYTTGGGPQAMFSWLGADAIFSSPRIQVQQQTNTKAARQNTLIAQKVTPQNAGRQSGHWLDQSLVQPQHETSTHTRVSQSESKPSSPRNLCTSIYSL